jgi:hypothetical protein
VSECKYKNPLVPTVAEVVDIKDETSDVKTFYVRNEMGYTDEQVITTLEMRMKCGIGKCGRVRSFVPLRMTRIL